MVFNVDKLKAQVHEWDTVEMPGVDVGLLMAAARMVVVGQPLWWCEVHDSPASAKTNGACAVAVLVARMRPCRMVEGWWMPTGTSE